MLAVLAAVAGRRGGATGDGTNGTGGTCAASTLSQLFRMSAARSERLCRSVLKSPPIALLLLLPCEVDCTGVDGPETLCGCEGIVRGGIDPPDPLVLWLWPAASGMGCEAGVTGRGELDWLRSEESSVRPGGSGGELRSISLDPAADMAREFAGFAAGADAMSVGDGAGSADLRPRAAMSTSTA